MKPSYEVDDKEFNAAAYKVAGYRGIAWQVLGWEVVETEETEWTGIKERTGNVVAVMVGDDRYFAFADDQIEPITRESYCGECGQIGCTHDGMERE